MILSRLKEQTSVQHERLESRLNLLNKDFTVAEYCSFLERFWGFYQPLEQQIIKFKNEMNFDLDYQSQLKTVLLEQDLKALGRDENKIKTLPLCRNLPDLTRSENVFGCLYVIEGATLGGQIISRHLNQKFGLTEANGAAFFSGYQERTGAMWREFKEKITAFAGASPNPEKIICSAQQTFEKLENWLFETPMLK